MTRASFGVTTHMTYQKPCWIWIQIVLKFSFLRNFVNSAHTDTCDASNESSAQGLHFFFLHLRAVSNIWAPSKQSTLADVSLTSVQRQFNVELMLD